MKWFKKASARRQAIRDDLAGVSGPRSWWTGGSGYIVLVSGVFFMVACLIQFWPATPLLYRQGELAPMDLVSPVDFPIVDKDKTERLREEARGSSRPVVLANEEVFNQIQIQMMNLRSDVAEAHNASQVDAAVLARFPGLTDAAVQWLQSHEAEERYDTSVKEFMNQLDTVPLVSKADWATIQKKKLPEIIPTRTPSVEGRLMSVSNDQVFVVDGSVEPDARKALSRPVMAVFTQALWTPVLNYMMSLKQPTFRFDTKLTAALADRRAQEILPAATTYIEKGKVIANKGQVITPEIYQELIEGQEALQQQVWKYHPWATWLSRLGRALIVLILTAAGAMYISRLTKVNLSVQRAWAVCGLLLASLITAKLMVIALPQTMYCMGLLPTLLTAIILVIAYNQRFALGVSAIHGLLVTLTLGQNIDFFLTMLAGVTVFSLGLSEIRTRGKLIEVGVVAAAVIFGTIWSIGLARMVGSNWLPWGGAATVMDTTWVAAQSLWGVLAGAGVAMVALFILPPVERVFKITTAMTLLELCDANKPLLHRLSQEAQGTFHHSLTVGNMAEAAGNAIGANGLLCRVGGYYHDIGKLSKPQYFIENQPPGRPNRHDKLSPAMSLLIIVGHVKDGIELSREYALPWIIHQFIAQHHGTTLVEYFYHAARKRAEQQARGAEAPSVSDTEFRYPGPKPQTREAAIVMICDGCESVVRSIEEPTPGRIETAVHNMITKRLMDGQFNECDLTLRDLSIIEETLVRTLGGVHHGRIAYPGRTEAEAGGSDVGISQRA